MMTQNASPVSSAVLPISSGPTWEQLLGYGLTDRVLILGQTGTGKTRLERSLLRLRKHVVVLETKFDLEGPHTWPGYETVGDLRSLARLAEKPDEHPRIVYRASLDAMQELEDKGPRARTEIDTVFRWVHERGHTTMAVDEAFDVTQEGSFRIPLGYDRLLRAGRTSFVSMVTCSQRPAGIARKLRTEAEHVFVFFLKDEDDRITAAKLTGLHPEDIRRLHKHEFYRATQPDQVSGPWKLEFAAA